MELTIFNLKVHGDERGSLIAIEENINIPINIKRVYYIFNTQEGVRRGCHAHKSLKQVLVCVHGSCKILLDDGREKVTVNMDTVSKALLVDCMIWHEMYDFSNDCVLLSLASDFYNEEDYIRDYREFITLLNNQD